jgi:hypothetical protein
LKSFGDNTGQEKDRVKLEYFDKKGKKLTLKEAFRQMCWKFHGRMPSHKRQEKRRQKEELLTYKHNAISVGLNPNLMGNGLGGPSGNTGSSG